MKCPQETHVLHAASENAWTSTLRAHVVSCESCAAAAGVAPFMARLSVVDVPRALPDPTLLWVRSQLAAPSAPEKVGRPVRVAQLLAYLAVTAGAIGLVVSKWSALGAWVSPVSAAGNGTAFVALALSFGAFALTSLAAALMMHAVLADAS
jgi:hypothetical protein